MNHPVLSLPVQTMFLHFVDVTFFASTWLGCKWCPAEKAPKQFRMPGTATLWKSEETNWSQAEGAQVENVLVHTPHFARDRSSTAFLQ